MDKKGNRRWQKIVFLSLMVDCALLTVFNSSAWISSLITDADFCKKKKWDKKKFLKMKQI